MIPNALPQSLQDNPILGRWIGFETPGRVRLSTGKVEIGQGVLTALVQIAADELDIRPDQIDLVSGDTARSPSEGYTAGSLSVEISGGSIRLVAAEIRRLMIEAAARQLGCEPDGLDIADGIVRRDGMPVDLDYWKIAREVDLDRPATGAAPLKAQAERRQIGRSLPRLDLAAKISGAGAPFIHDLTFPNMLHARVLHPPRRGARAGALAPDVIEKALGGTATFWRQGHFLAVLAETEMAAREAAERLVRHVVWSGGVAADDTLAEPDGLARFPSAPRLVVHPGAERSGRAVATHTATYTKPFIAHASIGPSCAMALFDGDALTLWSHTQGVFQLRQALAGHFALDVEKIHVRHAHGAGCYGHNGADDVAAEAAILAHAHPGRPVRVLWSRADELTAAPLGPAMRVSLSAGLDDTGAPVSWAIDVASPTHVARPGAGGSTNLPCVDALSDPPAEPKEIGDLPDAMGGGATRNAIALYDLPNQNITHRFVSGLPVRTSAMRGLGAFANVFAIESFMDELAAHAGVDPIAYRLRLLSDPRIRTVIETVARMSDWPSRPPKDTGRGRGFAWARYKNRSGILAVVVDVTVEETVRLDHVWAACDAGLIVNPDGARNQIEGGILQAASWTLKERVPFADGSNAATSWAAYPILTFREVPPVDVTLIPRDDAPIVGVGEVAQGPTAAAIANAVADALGVRVRDLPITRERLIAAAG
jgi:nicotinate dehydrogenase subunit B